MSRVWASTFLAFLATGAVLPVLPRYVSGPVGGGEAAVGLVVGAFAFGAVLARPFAGRLADARGRRPVVLWGTCGMALAGAGLLAASGVGSLVLVRLLLGVGEGFLFTAGSAWIVDLAPEERRGQWIGLYGLAIWGGLSVGPPIGEALHALAGFDAVWAFAALSPVAGALVAAGVPERWEPPPPSRERLPLVPVAARVPGVALALANVGYAALAGFVVLHLAEQGASGGPAVFSAFAVAVVLTRLVLGRLPDRVGAVRSAVMACAAEAAGLAVVAVSSSAVVAAAGAVLMGVGFSTVYPALALLVVDRGDAARQGAALGAFTAFFDVGVGLGAPLIGVVVELAGYRAGFAVGVACAAAAGCAVIAARGSARTAPAG